MRADQPRWRSRAVNLAVLGTAGSLATLMAGCSDSGSYQRNVYPSFADCIADYSATACTSRGTPGTAPYVGPSYRVVNGIPRACRAGDPGGGRAPSGRRISIEPARAGFGTSCRRTSSSRSRGRSWGS